MTGLLDGRRALVTGAASGIGRAIAAAYVAEGAVVTLADRDTRVEEVADEVGGRRGVVLDATIETEVDELVNQIVDHDGGLDILVCSHGILTQSPTVDMPTELWRETVDIDLTSVFLLNRAALRPMLAQGSGRIVNVASQLAIKGGVSLAHYAAAKAGVIAMSKSIALETAARGVLVNAIAPGPIDTPMVDAIDDEWKRSKRAELPLGRFGRPEEIAPVAVLLASDPGGNLFVGQVLGPNSGDVMP
ncbi:SDR family NAD(P)-dependent oxidoreductase [Gordonia terrae]|uniref:3-oxoacyl-[acyl-carrier-protein] reductase MabA n=2 Tax=Gordonia terrae TaxID=2055 RepID=A0AAD0NWD0_9ACTN|nr:MULTISPECIES: SDR family NAD(P)-dependent oxidoreductase [Gordonia]VTR10593.1 3-oxoacyl-(acyl-carrier-protein) reductase [Clostridioides difficile]ANY24205.1 3-oxoacyl-ACP reductase [Gordonia terrae]AWO84951.1 SDR family NAD(P)-dependent oxidoreductase [Gordonia terrae]VTS57638.1 3-oxoacyl-[acyl-carrier-protein] reductase FabG [Gordonia terrae]GAB42571.1 3-oxoacyl-[acyl-carrier-protein] reductase [Gordonia terrae NBRC 100016]